MLDINPDFGTEELIRMVRQSMFLQPAASIEFADVQVIDEEKALRLARQWVAENKPRS